MLALQGRAVKLALLRRLVGAGEGYVVDYLRVPVTDEKAPKPEDFGVLIHRCACLLCAFIHLCGQARVIRLRRW